MSSEFRAITLLNDNPSITYVGEWTTVQSTAFDAWGNFGPPLSPTLHSTTTISSFSFRFMGSSIDVIGTVDIANFSTNPDPTWECYINGISLGLPSLTNSKYNFYSMCNQQGFPDAENELIVNVTSNGMPFYLDHITYRAAPKVSLEDSLIAIQNPDPAIDYISKWSPNGIVNQTSDINSLVNVTFIGVQLSWYAYLASGTNASSGEYSIDGGSFTPFEIPGVPSTSPALFNQLLFDTSGSTLEMGTHVLSVKYTGAPMQGPLTLDCLIVTNGSFPSFPTSSSSTSRDISTSSSGDTSETKTHASNPTSSVNQPSGGSSKSNVGAIIGRVAGSIVGVLVMIIFFVWFKYYRRRSQGNHSHGIMPFLHQSTLVPSVPPLQTSQILKNHIQLERTSQSNIASTENAESNSLFATSSGSTEMATTSLSGHPLSSLSSVLPTHVASIRVPTNSILMRHEDSGIRFRPPDIFTTEGIEIPPTYTEQ